MTVFAERIPKGETDRNGDERFYHATASDRAEKILLAAPEFRTSGNDHGRGFYLTKDSAQAHQWAAIHGENGVVMEYSVDRKALESMRMLNTGNDAEAALFVGINRGKKSSPHGFDAIEGSMMLNPAEVRVEGKSPRMGGHQLSLHTPRSLSAIKHIRTVPRNPKIARDPSGRTVR